MTSPRSAWGQANLPQLQFLPRGQVQRRHFQASPPARLMQGVDVTYRRRDTFLRVHRPEEPSLSGFGNAGVRKTVGVLFSTC